MLHLNAVEVKKVEQFIKQQIFLYGVQYSFQQTGFIASVKQSYHAQLFSSALKRFWPDPKWLLQFHTILSLYPGVRVTGHLDSPPWQGAKKEIVQSKEQ